jgi:hypothetical protein
LQSSQEQQHALAKQGKVQRIELQILNEMNLFQTSSSALRQADASVSWALQIAW